MRAAPASLLLLLRLAGLPQGGGASSSFGRRRPLRTFQKPTASHRRARRRRQQQQRHNGDARPSASARDVLSVPRGGQQGQAGSGGGSTPSYHGNYVSSRSGEPPRGPDMGSDDAVPEAAVPTAELPAVPAGGAAAVAATATAAAVAPAAPAKPVLASATSKSAKLSNLQERTGPALGMLFAVYLLLKFTGSKGMIGLVHLMQWAMYNESTTVVEDFRKKEGGGAEDVASYSVQKWWWFATAVMYASGRSMIAENTSLTMDQLNLITFGMAAVSLVGAVIQLAMISSSEADSIYRSYLGKVACCHFSLLFLVGQSSFWIRTIKEYGLAWVLFPALLVVVNDTMAYVFGVLLGKHKLIPLLSPKKTVEGFVGAGLSTLAVAGPLLNRAVRDGVTNPGRHALVLAAYVSLVAPFGGFLASAVKRAHGAKDFGDCIPGHGGAVDRFDCQVVTAPFVYLYLKNCLVAAIESE